MSVGGSMLDFFLLYLRSRHSPNTKQPRTPNTTTQTPNTTTTAPPFIFLFLFLFIFTTWLEEDLVLRTPRGARAAPDLRVTARQPSGERMLITCTTDECD
jgi:hypothetical protein